LPDAPRDALGDADPAVVAARLAAAKPLAPRAETLLAALANPHDSLRRVAIRLLAARSRVAELASALAWLDDPRAPYAGHPVRRVHTPPIAAYVLASPSAGPGARAWAIDEAARKDLPGLRSAAEAEAHSPYPDLRCAALRAFGRLGDAAALLRALDDPDETV